MSCIPSSVDFGAVVPSVGCMGVPPAMEGDGAAEFPSTSDSMSSMRIAVATSVGPHDVLVGVALVGVLHALLCDP